LENCEERSHVSLSHPELGEDANTVLVNALRQLLHGAVSKGGIDGMKTTEDVEALLDALNQDLTNGHQISFEIKQVWGRKSAK
jgi:hypothetical protein